ncbi:methionine adenosyltransferase [bacterium]|nr:methionine adenosyltransferase [bacterium]
MVSSFISQTSARDYLFSSESVTEGHPDKVCDQISDAVLDANLAQDPNSRVACEVFALNGHIFIGGEITSKANIDIVQVARDTVRKIGYTDPAFGLDANTCKVTTIMSKQSPNIAMGVNSDTTKEQGAGDQGLMFGYASDETPELMPLAIDLSHKVTKRLSDLRKDGTLAWARPDGKAQITVRYRDGKPVEITTIVVSTQHSPDVSHDQIEQDIKEFVIKPICKQYLTENTKYFINPTGLFILGGPAADAGLTGRKIIVDTYGGMGHHGGGCFSGKDASKVDRSAAYMARHIAKNIVAAGLANRCEVQIAYSIGIAKPVSIYVSTFGTGKVDEEKIEKAIEKIFPLKPAELISYLDLKRPIFQKTASYGHFGRDDDDFTWEKTNKVDELKKLLL